MPRCAPSPTAPWPTATSLIEAFRFNVVVARVMELVNATRKAIDTGAGPADPAVREAAEAVAILLSLFAPYCAEDMWSMLGHETLVARAGYPAVTRPPCWSQETVTCVVQVMGKVRDRLEVPPGIGEERIARARARSSRDAVRALDGAAIRTVIVRAARPRQHRHRLERSLG